MIAGSAKIDGGSFGLETARHVRAVVLQDRKRLPWRFHARLSVATGKLRG